MCRWTVVGAPRARSSKCRLLGNKTRIRLNESAGTGATQLKESLLATPQQHRHRMSIFLSDTSLLQLYLTDTPKRDVMKRITVLFLRQPLPERSIPAPGAEDSPLSTYVLGHIATTRWPVSRSPGKFDKQELQMVLPAHLLFKGRLVFGRLCTYTRQMMRFQEYSLPVSPLLCSLLQK